MSSDNKTIVTRSRTRVHGDKIETPPLKPPKNREPTASSSQMHSKERKEVRIGDSCQVPLPEVESSYIGDDKRETYCDDLDVMVWNGEKELKDDDVAEYTRHAVKVHRIPVDKALYMLHTCNNDIDKAKLELYGHINLEDQWTADDDRVFWYAFQAFGKNFAKIKQLLPHKKMLSIINHYYATKKHQYYKSVLNDEMGKSATFDLSDDEEAEPQKRSHVFYICKNCGASVKRTYHVNLLEVCKACKLYFKVANEHRPVNRPRQFDKRVTCPPEMVEIAEQFAEMARESKHAMNGEDIVCVDRPTRTVCDDLIEETHIKIDSNKAKAHILNSKNNAIDYNEFCDVKKATELLERISNEKTSSRQRHSHTWSDYEQAAAFHCLIRFNNNYEAVAEVIGNKSTEMVKAFAIENQETIRKAIEQQQSLDKDINIEEELPKAPPAEIIDLD